MQKTISINSKEKFKIDNNVGWTMEYRDQFNHDIIPDLMPIMSAFFDLVSDVDLTGGQDALEVIGKLDADKIQDAFITLSGLEFTTFINIAWAMAKCADETIEEPKAWIKGFSSFPLDVIAPPLVKTMVQGLVSSKNYKSLLAKLATKQATTE